MRCRGGASPSRRRTGVISGPSIKRGWPPRFVIARRPQADVAISQFPAASWESYRRNRNCLPEIATAPLGPRNDTSGECRGAPAPSSGLIPLCKALNERRYRRNRSVRFYRHLVRTGSAFPRLPRPLWGLAMTRQGGAAMGTVRRTELALLLPLRGRAWLSPPLQGQCGLNDGRRMIHSSFFSIHYSLFHPSPCGGWQTI